MGNASDQCMNPDTCPPHTLLDVLLVDDDQNDLALFGMAADRTDFDIWLRTMTCAEEAIEYLEGKGLFRDRAIHPLPDVLVLDLNMPGLGGLGFLSWRRETLSFAKLPVLVLSAQEDKRQIERALALGANEFLRKPSIFEDWKEVIQVVWTLGTKRRWKQSPPP
jgi:CheY-like chemotaxis protein